MIFRKLKKVQQQSEQEFTSTLIEVFSLESEGGGCKLNTQWGPKVIDSSSSSSS